MEYDSIFATLFLLIKQIWEWVFIHRLVAGAALTHTLVLNGFLTLIYDDYILMIVQRIGD